MFPLRLLPTAWASTFSVASPEPVSIPGIKEKSIELSFTYFWPAAPRDIYWWDVSHIIFLFPPSRLVVFSWRWGHSWQNHLHLSLPDSLGAGSYFGYDPCSFQAGSAPQTVMPKESQKYKKHWSTWGTLEKNCFLKYRTWQRLALPPSVKSLSGKIQLVNCFSLENIIVWTSENIKIGQFPYSLCTMGEKKSNDPDLMDMWIAPTSYRSFYHLDISSGFPTTRPHALQELGQL